MSIFGTIAIDIFCVIGPLFPFTQFNLLNSLLIPVSIYTAIAIVVTIFIFPQTAHSAFLGTATRLLSQMKLLLDAQEDLLTAVPGSIAPGTSKFLQLRATRILMFTIHQGRTSLLTYMSYASLIEPNRGPSEVVLQGKFINAEFSRGRWNGDDAKRLEEPLFSVISRMSK